LPEVDTVSLKEARALIDLFLQTTITWNKACYHEMMTISATCQIILYYFAENNDNVRIWAHNPLETVLLIFLTG
jgi:hypothetical protein